MTTPFRKWLGLGGSLERSRDPLEQNQEDNPWRVASAISLIAAAIPPLLCVALLWPLQGDIPTWDQWHLIELWDAHHSGRPVLPLLLEPYNGHYNVLPRFIFFGLGVLTNWNLRAEVALSFLLALGTLILLLHMLRKSDVRLLVLAAPVSAVVFSLAQYENFMSGYPMGQVLAHCAALVSIYLLTVGGRGAFALALLAAVVATFSHGVAVSVWPAGALLLVIGGRRPAYYRLVIWVLPALGAALMMRSLASSTGVAIDIPRAIPFTLALLGKSLSWSAAPSIPTAVLLGAGLVLTFLICVAFWRRGSGFRAESVFWIGVGIMALGSAVLVALGRSFAGIGQSFASHYVTAAYPLVLATMVLAGTMCLRFRSTDRFSQVAFSMAVVLVLLQTAAASADNYRNVRAGQEVVKRHNTLLLEGKATDEEIRRTHYPEPEIVKSGIKKLREMGLTVFAKDRATARPIGNVDRFASQAVTDQAPILLPAGEPWRIEGWAAGSREKGGEVDAVILEIDGLRVAEGETGLPRKDVVEYFSSASFLDTGWFVDFPAAGLLAPGKYAVRILASSRDSPPVALLENRVVLYEVQGHDEAVENLTVPDFQPPPSPQPSVLESP